MNKAVFLDRDGVINRSLVKNGKPYPPPSLAELEILSGVIEATNNLSQAGFKLIVVTNQPDVATGKQQQEVVEAMHQYLLKTLPIDDIRVCYHVDKDNCSCRKPKPGMLLEAAQEGNISLEHSYMVGDRWRDIEAGIAAGCKTILIKNNYAEQQPEKFDAVVDSLLEASAVILAA